MTPDYTTAAIRATETLIKRQIQRTPIDTLPIVKSLPNVFLLSFAEIASINNVDRNDLISCIGMMNQDAITIVKKDGDLEYLVAYNQYLPHFLIQRALARELAHIVLGHDGSKPLEVRNEEAHCFARHLICPRPLLKAISEADIPLTEELIGCLTGCRDRCLEGIRTTPGVHVPAELNRMVREQFSNCIENFINYANVFKAKDKSRIADLGSYMDEYED